MNDVFSMGGTAHVNINGTRFEVKNGEVWINGKKTKVPPGDPSPTPPNNVKVKDNGSYEVNGDLIGNLSLFGNYITVIVNGDLVGNVAGATTVTVKGDHVGMS